MKNCCFCFLMILAGCVNEKAGRLIHLKNNLSTARSEVVAISLNKISTDSTDYNRVIVKDGDSTLVSQLYDSNFDSIHDELLIYISLDSGEQKDVQILISAEPRNQNLTFVYSRFVPERIDDYAWENDRVAFRMYGPEAQRLVEEGKPGGTLSSGIDCWLKRVDYPVIDKWYQKYVDGGTYHQDSGEGYDPYHVGASLGCGGVSVRTSDSLFVSKNFVSWKKIADGPIRNVFELNYAPWKAGDISVQETKRISIDVGSQLTMVEEQIKTSGALPDLTIGLTLHEGKGQTIVDSTHGVFGYWEQIDDAFLGTGVIVPVQEVLTFEEFRSSEMDKSHLFVNVRAEDKTAYYTGFAWSKAGHITSQEEWKEYLMNFSKRLDSPIQVVID